MPNPYESLWACGAGRWYKSLCQEDVPVEPIVALPDHFATVYLRLSVVIPVVGELGDFSSIVKEYLPVNAIVALPDHSRLEYSGVLVIVSRYCNRVTVITRVLEV